MKRVSGNRMLRAVFGTENGRTREKKITYWDVYAA
jgi:hypothetical protein